MQLLTINLMSSCNHSCNYCPVKKWLKPIDFSWVNGDGSIVKLNGITNKILLKWLRKYIDPKKWVIEITGGEPGLYPEIKELILLLNKYKYYGVIKTNGTLPIPKNNNFIRVACWHMDMDFPKYYDTILIIKNPNDDWRKKADYCIKNNIKYKTTVFDEYYKTGESINSDRCNENHIIGYLHIDSVGRIAGCSRKPNHGYISQMSEPKPLLVYKDCPKCKNINDVEVFLPENIKQKINKDYEEVA